MKRLRVLLLSCALCSCDEAMERDEAKEGHNPTAPTFTLEDSLSRWQKLASEGPGRYWYEDEICGSDAAYGGSSTIVEVDGTGTRSSSINVFPRDMCMAEVDRWGRIDGTRYGVFDGTFEKLYSVCESLLRQRDDVELSFDAEGIIKSCWAPSIPGPKCTAHCGAGFYLRTRGFGDAPARPAIDGGAP